MASSVGNIETGGGKTDMVPHWKIIPGNLRFFLDGRIRTVKAWYYVPLSLGITLVTGGIHFPIDGPFLAEKVSMAIPIVGFTVYILTIIHFLACFFIDPGYLPRASAYEAFVIEKENNILTDLSGAYYPPPRNKMVKVNGFDYEMRFCTTCKFYRPVRTVHCKHCNMCVDRFDHHCPWVGNCIGKRNHRYFFLFLVFAYSTAAYGCFSSIATTVMKSLLPNRPADISASIIVMTVAFLSLLFLSKLTVCHWVFVCNDKTTNEKIKKKYKSNAHNPFRGHPFKNFARLVCFSQSPPYIDYRKKLPIDYYQEYDKNLEILRSSNNFPGSFYSSKLLIPIPGDVLYREIIRRNDNRALKFNEEVQVLNSKIESKISYDMLVNDDDKRYIQTRQFLNNEFVDYCFRGFAGAKNYLILKSFENKSFYWTFIHDFKISNIVLFEDKSDEEKFLHNYSFIYDPETINTISHLTNLNIQFMSSKSFTNFSVSKFRTSWKTYQKDAKNSSPNEVKVYRFWAFDAKETFLPSESPFYLKFIRLINRNNPSTPKNSPTVYSNYLFHAQKFERIFGFIVMDHVCDELILKQRFSPVNAINLLSREQNNINKTKFMLSQHLFLYISSLIAWQMSSDLDVDQVDGYIQTLLKYSYKSKEKSPIQTQFDNLRQTVFADFSLRKNLPMLRNDVDYPDYFQFSLYDTHDLTLVVGKSGYNDELIEYITRNNIDLLISINLSHHDFKKSLKRTSFFSFMETALPNTLEIGGDQVVMKKQKINFKLDISKLYDVPQDPRTPPKFSYLMECDFTQVIIDQFDLKPAISFLNGERSYSFGMVELLCSILMNILANKNEFYKRCVILCNDPKLAALFTIAYVNLRQAQVERTMNINMAAHMVLTKLAYYVCANTNYDTAILDHESVFNKVFDLEEYKLVCETSALISQDLLQSNEQ